MLFASFDPACFAMAPLYYQQAAGSTEGDMALIDCPECKAQVSDKAPTCPQCGAPIAAAVPTSHLSALSPPKKRRAGPRWGLLVLLAACAVIVVWFWRSTYNERAAPPSAGLLAAIRQPKTLVNERVQLNEGQHVLYSFTLNSDARVQVKVAADPKQVDVMLMSKTEADEFKQVSAKLLGGKYTYRQVLSSQKVLQMDKNEILPSGDWCIVVMRPREALLGGTGTAASISITVF